MISRAKSEYRTQSGKDGMTANGTEIAAIETAGMTTEDEHLIGPQSAATGPIGERTTQPIGAKGPHRAVTADPHMYAEPADDLAWSGSNNLHQQAIERKIVTQGGESPEVHRQADQYKISGPGRRCSPDVEPDRDAGRKIHDEGSVFGRRCRQGNADTAESCRQKGAPFHLPPRRVELDHAIRSSMA